MKNSSFYTLGGGVFLGAGWMLKFSGGLFTALGCFTVALVLFAAAVYWQYKESMDDE